MKFGKDGTQVNARTNLHENKPSFICLMGFLCLSLKTKVLSRDATPGELARMRFATMGVGLSNWSFSARDPSLFHSLASNNSLAMLEARSGPVAVD